MISREDELRLLGVVGLRPGATVTDIERARKELSKFFHPDRYQGESENLRATASRRMADVNAACDKLIEISREREAAEAKRQQEKESANSPRQARSAQEQAADEARRAAEEDREERFARQRREQEAHETDERRVANLQAQQDRLRRSRRQRIIAYAVGGVTLLVATAIVVAFVLDTGPDTAGVAMPTTSAAETTIQPDAPTVIAARFMIAWLRKDLDAASWRSGVGANCTSSLAQQLNGVEPKFVPASQMAGTVNLVRSDQTSATVTVRVDTGVVTIQLVRDGNTWLVDGVDWVRS